MKLPSIVLNSWNFFNGKKTYISAIIAILYGFQTKDYNIVLTGLISLCGRQAIAKVEAAIFQANTIVQSSNAPATNGTSTTNQ